jgi:hypothetical protein
MHRPSSPGTHLWAPWSARNSQVKTGWQPMVVISATATAGYQDQAATPGGPYQVRPGSTPPGPACAALCAPACADWLKVVVSDGPLPPRRH